MFVHSRPGNELGPAVTNSFGVTAEESLSTAGNAESQSVFFLLLVFEVILMTKEGIPECL